jgi:hypothetical protein
MGCTFAGTPPITSAGIVLHAGYVCGRIPLAGWSNTVPLNAQYLIRADEDTRADTHCFDRFRIDLAPNGVNRDAESFCYFPQGHQPHCHHLPPFASFSFDSMRAQA